MPDGAAPPKRAAVKWHGRQLVAKEAQLEKHHESDEGVPLISFTLSSNACQLKRANHSFVLLPPVIIKHYTAAASIQAEAASFAQVTPCDCRCQATPESTKPTPTSPKNQPPSHSKAFTSQTRKLPQWTPGWHVTFVECTIYRTADDPDYAKTLKDGVQKRWIIAEELLEGRYTKWNNNGGSVRARPAAAPLTAIREEDEEENDENEDTASGEPPIVADDVIQAFSHFTASTSNFRRLVCDLQVRRALSRSLST